MHDLKAELESNLEGEVRFDEIIRKIYSVDASIYELAPIGVAYPKSAEDIAIAVKIANAHNIPVIARGAATGITGGCLGKGLIIDCSRYLNTIHKIDIENQYAICDPGVVQDRLNDALRPYQYRLGPDTSTGNRATLGGMLANNAAGSRSLKYGRMVDSIQELDLILSHGELIHLEKIGDQHLLEGSRKSQIIKSLMQIRNTYADLIKERFPRIPRRVSGYNLDELLLEDFNPCKLIAGSEGTLGIVSRMKVSIAPCPNYTGLCLLFLDSMLTGMTYIPQLLEFHPISIEMIDRKIIQAGKESPSTEGSLTWLQGDPEAVFAVEVEGQTANEVIDKLQDVNRFITTNFPLVPTKLLTDKQEMDKIWAVRKAGLGLLLSKRSYSRAIAFIEDVTVAPAQLANFIKEFLECLKKHKKEAGIYGHVGSGCMHIRPYIDLRQPEEREKMLQITQEVAVLLIKYGGAPSGEHGDGLVRSWLNKQIFGEKLYQGFEEVKYAFDPDNLMNPGKVVDGQPLLENLHHSPTAQNATPTFQDFTPEGGFDFAVDMCNGNGQCRKSEGTMCPSFQATNNEYDTTRARAQALRAITNGTKKIDSFAREDILDVLDLCLECKGCKKECPSQVDMAKLKAEFLYQYQKKHGYFFRSRLFAGIGATSYLASFVPRLYNSFINSGMSKSLFNFFGITSKRDFPILASETFSSWFNNYVQIKSAHSVVLFNDTYNEFYDPQIGKAAVKLLNMLGYQVIVPEWKCCGRPGISKGFLEDSRKKAQNLIKSLIPYASKGTPIIGLEPSCILTLKDDYRGLIGNQDEEAKTVAKACITIDEFVYSQIDKLSKIASERPKPIQSILVHGHCHQKALVGMQPSIAILRAVFEEVKLIDDGCCGLAGSFGYEKEHYDLSIEIAKLKLLPALGSAKPGTLIVANGTSCRSQIIHNTDHHPIHVIEALVLGLH